MSEEEKKHGEAHSQRPLSARELGSPHAELIGLTVYNAWCGLSVAVNVICGHIDCHMQDNKEKALRLPYFFSRLHLNCVMLLTGTRAGLQENTIHFKAAT